MKWILALGLLAIVVMLIMAGRAMLKTPESKQAKPHGMMRALALRVALSVALFVFIWVAYQLGWIKPTGVPM